MKAARARWTGVVEARVDRGEVDGIVASLRPAIDNVRPAPAADFAAMEQLKGLDSFLALMIEMRQFPDSEARAYGRWGYCRNHPDAERLRRRWEDSKRYRHQAWGRSTGWRGAFDPEASYWVGATQAAKILGVNVSRFESARLQGPRPLRSSLGRRTHHSREQMLTAANAREAQRH